MTREALVARLHEIIAEQHEAPISPPGTGHTAELHLRLFAIGREDLSLARLVEAHWDALAILAEAGNQPERGAIYGVWAAEAPAQTLRIEGRSLSGTKPFCSGAGIVDRALVTVKEPHPQLVDLDLQRSGDAISFDDTAWSTSAFAETRTSTATFHSIAITEADLIGKPGFYLQRPGFWHGACGPAACWAGGAAGLLDWALQQKRSDPHTLAHLGAMKAAVWTMQACLTTAGHEIDAAPDNSAAAQPRALILRHLIEQGCTDVLRRLARAYGPHALAIDARIARRYQELDLYVRQSHAERDLETLGSLAPYSSAFLPD